jgi:hypothetical protein
MIVIIVNFRIIYWLNVYPVVLLVKRKHDIRASEILIFDIVVNKILQKRISRHEIKRSINYIRNIFDELHVIKYIENPSYCAFHTSRRNYRASVQSEYSIVDLIQESRNFIGHLRLLV